MTSSHTSKKDKSQLYTENGLTLEEEQEILHDADEARRDENTYGPYMSVDELLAELKKPL